MDTIFETAGPIYYRRAFVLSKINFSVKKLITVGLGYCRNNYSKTKIDTIFEISGADLP